ncbi:MAG: GAF domain-containing SpoIIE family protein phosphatase [bacterium]
MSSDVSEWARKLSILRNLNVSMQKKDSEEILRLVLEGVHDVLDFDRVIIYAFNSRTNGLEGKLCVGFGASSIDDIKIPVGEVRSIAAKAILERRPLKVVDPKYDLRCGPRFVEVVGAGPFAVIPLVVDPDVVGAIYADNGLSGKDIADEDLELLTSFAVEAGIAIQNSKLRDTMRRKIDELTTLMEVSTIVNSTRELDELLDLVMELSKNVLKAEASSVLLIDEKSQELYFESALGEKANAVKSIRLKMGEGIAGWVAKEGKPLLVSDVTKDPRFYKKADEKTKFQTKSILCVPLRTKKRIVGVVEVLNRLESAGGPAFTEEDIPFFTALAHQSAIAIENAILYREVAEKERLARELEIARQIQKALLPEDVPQFESIKMSVMSIPAREVGGDYYDFIPLEDDRLGIVVADVSGKGVPAALFMTMARSILRTYATGLSDPGEILTMMNNAICGDTEIGRFITVLYMILNPRTRELDFANGGHDPMIVYRSTKKTCEFFEEGGRPIGIAGGISYNSSRLRMEPGDVAVLYTDGVPEAMNPKREQFGFGRLVDIILQHADSETPEGLRDRVYRSITEFVGDAPQHDDLTLAVIKAT